jgi:hypothetical protein
MNAAQILLLIFGFGVGLLAVAYTLRLLGH